ncbi:hypothetical protein [Silvimonas amylolytica]|uniref:Uncharacterized protein n=1 Tax=Silvimonas amylolytica TaxID=449663 RepID=A0ABQ2PHW0_9NEIS|nr:hypothetical protein [Silvimonas amylolytica]GGP25197.1 hypothetical protein GCM10010971_10160 [Silvimonas amylolytica]
MNQPLWQVTRNVHLISPLADAQLTLLRSAPGVSDAVVSGKYIAVTYDVRAVHYGAILARTGLSHGGWWNRLRAAWFGNLDRNLADTLQAKAGACCNQPPVKR